VDEACRRAHVSVTWSKRRISDELAKDNNWVPLVSPNTVKRIVQDAGLWPEAESGAKKGGQEQCSQRRRSWTESEY
jgi:hypothetical protein